MAKESLYPIGRQPIWRETFESEDSVRRNGGVPSGVTFSNGAARLSGLISYIAVDHQIKGVYSVRLKCTLASFASLAYLLDFRTSGTVGTGFVFSAQTTGVITTSSGAVYINGIASSTLTLNRLLDIVISGMAIGSMKSTFNILSRFDPGYAHGGASIELFEIYSGTLTPDEVKNLYENKRYRELNVNTLGRKEILDVSADSGVVRNRLSGDTINGVTVPSVIPTAVSVVKQGDVLAMKFNGNSKIDAGSYDPMTGDRTFIAWVQPDKYDSITNLTSLFHNSQLQILIHNTNRYIYCTSNATTWALGTAGSVPVSKVPKMIVVTRASGGATNIYINTVLNGTANQSSGIPVAGTTNLTIGNRSTGNMGFIGTIDRPRIIDGILTPEEISQLYHSEKIKYGL